MNLTFKFTLLATFTLITSTSLFARWTTQEEVMRAATTTLAKPLFQKNFPNASIASVVDLGDLWCVNLAPKGHLLFAASTKQTPLLAYGFGTYATPNEKSPEFTLLSGMHRRAKQLESQTVATFSTSLTPAEAEWEALLNPQPKAQFFTVTEEEKEEGEEEEGLSDSVDLTSEDGWNTDWNQCEPWNDFCPQFGAESAAKNAYHNRAPVGGAATMYTQIMKYYEWPQRIDTIYADTLTAHASVLKDDEGNRIDYDMRFHGGLPIQWDKIENHYWEINTLESGAETMARLYSSEKDRFDVARLGLLIDIIAKMEFNAADTDGSGTTLVNGCSNDWYEFGTTESKDTTEEKNVPFTEEQLQNIKTVLSDGMPLPASIPGHAIFVCGYQETEGETFLRLNYGWNNSKHNENDTEGSNRYYLAGTVENKKEDATQLDAWVLGHAPKMQVQVTPLPKVVNVNALPTLTWMVPKYHAEDFTSFTVSATPYSADATTTYDTIDAFEDATADENLFSISTLEDEAGNQADALTINASQYGIEVYAFPEAFIPTEDTTFSFDITDLRNNKEEPFNTMVNVQLWNEEDMTWKTLATFPEKNQDLPEAIELSLANVANRFCKLRLSLSDAEEDEEEEGEEDGNEENEGEGNEESAQTPYYALTNLILDNVYAPGTTKTKNITKAATRKLALTTNLMPEVGARYRIKVNATTAENDPVHFGETFTRLTDEAVATPSIQSITPMGDTSLIDDILLKGDLYGTSTFRVTCNDDVTKIRVWPSCTTLITDDDITIEKQDNASVFDITIQSPEFNPSELDALDGSRMILTLEARTAQGNVVYRDITLALRTVIEWSVDTETLEIPRAWFREYNLADADTSVDELTVEELKALAEEDYDEDGLLNWQEYLCGTNPTDDTAKLQIKDLVFNEDGTLQKVIYTPETAANGTITLEGKATLTDASWAAADLTTHRFFRLRVTK